MVGSSELPLVGLQGPIVWERLDVCLGVHPLVLGPLLMTYPLPLRPTGTDNLCI